MGAFGTPINRAVGAATAAADLDPGSVEYCVFDLETTGLYDRDRVIEVGMTRVDGSGRVLAEYETLVNPGRTATDTTHIHGITDSVLLDAPSFDDVLGDLAELLDGAIWVAHNAPFDVRFLSLEFERCGEVLPGWPTLCTMRTSSYIGGPRQPTLHDCCRHFGVELEGEMHTAIVDARATAKVLASAILRNRPKSFRDLPTCSGDPWSGPLPSLSVSHAPSGHRRRRDSPREETRVRIGDESAKGSGPEGIEKYREVLAASLEDRVITEEEATTLVGISRRFGLTPSQAQEVHASHFQHLAEMAMADGHLSRYQRLDLEHVAELLGLDEATAEQALASAEPDLLERLPLEELRGKSVCFTGEVQATRDGRPVSREEVMAAAEEIGMVPRERVTKKLDILAVTDPHSMSGKAQKAREYGTRIIAARAFLTAIGFSVD